jgi:hypothetical protein
MARKKADDNKVVLGTVSGRDMKVTATSGDIDTGFIVEKIFLLSPKKNIGGLRNLPGERRQDRSF